MRALGLGRAAGRYPAELMTAYRRLLDDPGTVEAICEDYRAGAEHRPRARRRRPRRRRIECPLLALWSARGALPRLYGDVLEVWRPWAREVQRPRPRRQPLPRRGPPGGGRRPRAARTCSTPEPPTRRPDHVHDATTNAPRDDLAGKLKRTELQHSASSIPGREIVQVLTEIPAGVDSGWHQHPGEEVGYILAGTVAWRSRAEPTLTLQAGDGFLIPPRTPHNALDLGPDTGPDALDLHRRGRRADRRLHETMIGARTDRSRSLDGPVLFAPVTPRPV